MPVHDAGEVHKGYARVRWSYLFHVEEYSALVRSVLSPRAVIASARALKRVGQALDINEQRRELCRMPEMQSWMDAGGHSESADGNV